VKFLIVEPSTLPIRIPLGLNSESCWRIGMSILNTFGWITFVVFALHLSYLGYVSSLPYIFSKNVPLLSPCIGSLSRSLCHKNDYPAQNVWLTTKELQEKTRLINNNNNNPGSLRVRFKSYFWTHTIRIDVGSIPVGCRILDHREFWIIWIATNFKR